MIARHQILSMALVLSVLPAGLTEALTQDSSPDPTEGVQQTERKITILRRGGERVVDLEAVEGPRGFLGVGLLELTPELREHFGVPKDRGIMISSIVAGSPAERAGLQPADILTEVDGESLPSPIDLSIRVARAAEGAELELERWRNGRMDLLTVAVELRTRSQLDISPLVRHRIEIDGDHRINIDGEHRLEFRGVDAGGEENLWIEKVADAVGDSFSEASFIQQLEALRRERSVLLEKLDRMEGRLEALESELRRLDADHR